ncbi:MAG: hypothetical protein ACYCX4_15595 [Bacillota bacterium]
MTLNDRFTKGLVAGIAAGLVSTTWNLLSFYILHFAKHNFSDFPAYIIYGYRPNSLPQILFSEIIDFVWYSIAGIAFAFFVCLVNKKNITLKGLIWGIGIWFFTYMFTLLFEIKGFTAVPFRSTVSHFIGASIWGVFLALFFNYLEEKVSSD